MSSSQIQQQLDRARVELLDLTARNRLISTSRSSSRSSRLEIVDELADEIFRRVCIERKGMAFKPKAALNHSDKSGRESRDQSCAPKQGAQLAQPDDEVEANLQHTDQYLQTTLSSEKLQSRLLGLFYDARTYEQEHGANVLYLAAGMLKWYDGPTSQRARYAPLILIPVTLDRKNATARFRLRASDDEIRTNLSLREKLRLEFGIDLPEIPECFGDDDSMLPSQYFEQVRRVISDQPRWEVLADDIVLWLYSFAKFLMYQDLNPDSWPNENRIHSHPLVASMLSDGFESDQVIFDESDSVDKIVSPSEMYHVMDADSSQMLVIEESKCGTNLVVQGPPGTGKSQTITNMIATAVASGKRVLFVAEKMAALEVVKRRMDNVGLGEMCLELHSHKANKRDVLKDLHGTLHLAKPTLDNPSEQCTALAVCRGQLNRHASAIHSPIANTEQTPYEAIGQLVRLNAQGVSPAEFTFPHATQWSPGELGERRRLLEDLVTQLKQIGNPSHQPWRGCEVTNVLPADINRMLRNAAKIVEPLKSLDATANELADQIPCVDERSIQGADRLAAFANWMCDAPNCDRSRQSDDAWSKDNRDELKRLVLEIGPTAQRCLSELEGVVTDVAWQTELGDVRRHLAMHGRSLFRIFHKDYREACTKLAGVLVDRPPRSLDERLRIVDALIEGQKAISELSRTTLLQSAFGKHDREEHSNWAALAETIQWRESCEAKDVPESFFPSFANLSDAETLNRNAKAIESLTKQTLPLVEAVLSELVLDLRVAFGVNRADAIDRNDLLSRLAAWKNHPEKLQQWIAYNRRYRKTIAADLGDIAFHIHNGSIISGDVIDQFESAYYESILRQAYRDFPELAEFEGKSHENTLSRFAELDRGRIETARSQVAAKHHAGLPTNRKSPGMGVLRHEMKKKTRHKPLRKLIESCGPEIQAIKPVFMMSPMSVAQYLPPGAVEFDILLIDEASQVRPCDAIGAMARAKQVVVVGDDLQLPPTTFFSKTTNDVSDADGEQQNLTDLESVLGLCESKNMPSRMLRWHYRSLHQSLIAVSNKEFYDNRLFVVPSPHHESDDLGLRFRHVPDGVYDRGGSSANIVEAQAVAEAVMRHARDLPHKSLGVGAFSVAQRDAILLELERLRRDNPRCERFFVDEGPEPFFVKNLENIQGDERDCIFISVGYGRDSRGKLSMSFGPLNRDGGERRLNVLISRAKERCEVFSSITADDIDLSKTDARGVTALKTFLRYAETKVLDAAKSVDNDYDSEFERQVALALESQGFEVDAQVGMAGFVVDLAVKDPENDERYLLGIECDGASYHSAKSARDRDRIRQEILEQRGWIIHRIWSTDWFHRPDEKLKDLIAAIHCAKTRIDGQRHHQTGGQSHSQIKAKPIVREQAQSRWGVPVSPYVESDFPINRNASIAQTDRDDLMNIVTMIANIEGPIHHEEIHTRVRGLWGVSRRGRRIDDAIESALHLAEINERLRREGVFYWPIGMSKAPIRNRTAVWQSSLRKPDHIPPEEIEAIIGRIAQTDASLPPKEALRRLCAILGISRPSVSLVDQIESRFSKSSIQQR